MHTEGESNNSPTQAPPQEQSFPAPETQASTHHEGEIIALSAAEVVAPYWRWLRSIAHEHPALILSIAYLFLASVGITYDYWLFGDFGVDVLDYAEAGDFLLAAVREPVVVVLSVLSLMVILGLQEADYRLRLRYTWWRRMYARPNLRFGNNARVLRISLMCLAVWYFVALFTPFYAASVARNIRRGRSTRVAIQLSSELEGARPAAPREFVMIGTTTRFVFVYDLQDKTAHILPFDSIAEMIILRPRNTTSVPPLPQ